MEGRITSQICGTDVTILCVIVASVFPVVGLIKIIASSGGYAVPVGALCVYGGCKFEENIELMFKVVNIIQGALDIVFGSVFLAGVVKRNSTLVTTFVVFMGFDVALTVGTLAVAAVKMSNFLAISYISLIDASIVLCQLFVIYVAADFKLSISRRMMNTEYLRLSNLCLFP